RAAGGGRSQPAGQAPGLAQSKAGAALVLARRGHRLVAAAVAVVVDVVAHLGLRIGGVAADPASGVARLLAGAARRLAVADQALVDGAVAVVVAPVAALAPGRGRVVGQEIAGHAP